MRHHNALAAGYRLHWYRIESVLGQGGFGITYLATDTNLDQPVAIKEFLPSELAVRTQDSSVHPVSDARSDTFGWGLTRFLTEARTLAQFRHPNIVRVYSVFEANGTAYMVMEYERGTSLEDALKFRYLEGEHALVSLVHALMDGLELVHQAGFIHRDIKPDNIFMRANDGVPVLLDFGSARQAVGVETRTLTSLVTPGYAPFEQYNATRENDRQGPWTDIYSLAATLYRGITGNGPIDAVARADALLSGKLDPLITLARLEPDGFSPRLLEAVDAGLTFQPQERPQSLAEWRTMLPSRPTSPDFTSVVRTRRAESAVSADEETVVRSQVPSRSEPTMAGRPATASAAAPVPEPARPSPPGPPPQVHTPALDGSSRRGSRTAVIGALVLVVAVAAAAGWFFLGQGERPALAPPPDAVAGSSSPGTPASAVQPAPTAQAPDPPQAVESPKAGEESENLLADARERLEAERRALAAEREKLALVTQQRDLEVARQEADKQARQIAAARERLERDRRELEAMRAAEQERAARAREAAEAAAQEAAGASEVPVTSAVVEAQSPDTPVSVAPPVAEEVAQPEPVVASAGREAPAAPAQPSQHAAAVPGNATSGQIDVLLREAEQDLAALRLTSPPERNAFERYRAVLELDPDNAQARSGLEKVVSRYLALADDAAAKGDFARGEAMLDRASRVDPDDARVDQARSRLSRGRADAEAREIEARRLEAQTEQRRLAEQAREREAAAREERARREAQRQEAERRQAAEQAREAQRAAAEAAAAQKARAEAQARRTVKLAVFPHDSIRTCFYSVGPRLHDAARAAANASGNVDVVYSYYVRNADASIVGSGGRLWQGTAAKKSPNVAAVQAAARQMGADAVLMAWYDCHSVHSRDEDTYRADVYLVDVRTGKRYSSVKGLLDTGRAVSAVLAPLYAERGL